jgi:lipoprotein-anchoring transpeptidase ErfK/SrfK
VNLKAQMMRRGMGRLTQATRTPPAQRAAGGRALATIGAALALAALGAACGGAAHQADSPAPSPTTPAAHVHITPGNGARNASPQHGITVRVTHGKLVGVTVITNGDPVKGSVNAAGTVWHSKWTLDTATRYTVHATALDKQGHTVAESATFRTLSPHHTFTAQIFEGQGQTYGVGMPIMLTFSQPITNRKAVERSLQLWASKRVVGAWYWDGQQTVYFRPRNYWPAHTRVRFVGRLNGVEGAPGVYGTHTLSQTFEIGRSLIVVVSTANHHMEVYLDRHLFATWPISSGKPGDETPNGTYMTIEKGNPVEMKGPGYDLMVPLSVRFTWSGAYLHAAAWSVGAQGFSNVSHGCVNMPPADAQIYYNMAVPGDPVTVEGSPKAGVWDNGWTMWFLRWRDWLKGSALHKAVRVGPTGSKLVRPASVRRSRAKAPLAAPQPGNAAAS